MRALDIFVFNAAAEATAAMEGEEGGVFTASFVKNMTVPDITLEELSQRIRTEMTGEDEDEASSFANDSESNRIVQVSPAESTLRNEYLRWCFYEGSTMCCGAMPVRVESCLSGCVYGCYCEQQEQSGYKKELTEPLLGGGRKETEMTHQLHGTMEDPNYQSKSVD